MRRLVTAPLAALILLCTPISNPQRCRLYSNCWTPLLINLFRGGAPPVQASASELGAASVTQESVSLEPGKPIERELSGGQSHFYKITLLSGQYLQIVVEQRGIDVAVTLLAPDGKKISEVDSENVIEGSETVSAIAEATGEYMIEVRSPE